MVSLAEFAAHYTVYTPVWPSSRLIWTDTLRLPTSGVGQGDVSCQNTRGPTTHVMMSHTTHALVQNATTLSVCLSYSVFTALLTALPRGADRNPSAERRCERHRIGRHLDGRRNRGICGGPQPRALGASHSLRVGLSTQAMGQW